MKDDGRSLRYVLATMLRSSTSPSQSLITPSLQRACTNAVFCAAFLAGPVPSLRAGGFRLIPSHNYLDRNAQNVTLPAARSGVQCCIEQMAARKKLGQPYRSNKLPPPFFCAPHNQETLWHQYRFLPALAF